MLLAGCASSVPRVADDYLDRYFAHYPTRATQAGRHDHDRELEHADASWIAYNEAAKRKLAATTPRDDDERLDALLLSRHIDRELFRRDEPRNNPLYWTEIVANSVVYLLVRDNRPTDAVARVRLIPRLAREAEATLTTDAAPEICAIAASQARASAEFFRGGFTRFDAASGRDAAAALDHLGSFLDDLGKRATGSPRLGARYAESLRLTTGENDPDALLARAEHDLAELRKEYKPTTFPHHADVDSWVAYAAKLVDEAEAFTKSHDVVTLPEPRTLVIDKSPSYFTGQSVGGVYPAGPYDPDANTLYFIPVPSGDAEAFFRDFNDSFMRMITAHEILPGHYVQLKYAAHNPHKVRAVFPDDVYVEGWGTFCEREMLDLGWGGPLERAAHIKKQMENIARVIVDIRVHTKGMTRDEVVRFVTDEAMQGPQLAANMWTRAITTSPQITTYYLGYARVRALFDVVRARRGTAFRLRDFTDELMRIGPVPIDEVRRIMLAPNSATVPSNNRSNQNGETNPPRG